MSYVSYMSYVYHMSYLSYMSYVCRLYELYELCKLYEYFINHLKSVEIAWDHMNVVFKKFDFFFVNRKKKKYWEKILKQDVRGSIFRS